MSWTGNQLKDSDDDPSEPGIIADGEQLFGDKEDSEEEARPRANFDQLFEQRFSITHLDDFLNP